MAINRKKLEDYIEQFYKPNFEAISAKEIYKWDAMQNFRSIHFLDGWYDETEMFYNRFSEALDSLHNLLNGFFAAACLRDCAKAFPLETKKALSDLNYAGQRGENAVEIMEDFEATMRELTARIKPKKVYVDSFKGYRAAALLLFFMHPDKYFFYKSDEYDAMREITEFVPDHDQSKYESCQILSDEILNVVKQDTELCSWYDKRRIKYDGIDPEYHLLVQDILWSTNYYEDYNGGIIPWEAGGVGEGNIEEIPYPSFGTPNIDLSPKKGKDYENEQRKNRELGLAGERYVMRIETEKLLKLFPDDESKRPEHISVTQGDGMGYDIRSYDENGNKIFIEVKTTSGPYSTAFFLTRNELIRSETAPKEFRLYRVYNFKDGSGKIGVTPGSMKKYCTFPTKFSIIFKK